MLRQTFTELLERYTGNAATATGLWSELERNYTAPGRYYHTLDHLQNLLYELTAVKDDIHSWDTALFALFYHDAVYDVTCNDNEEQSAMLARTHLDGIVPSTMLSACTGQILATKKHEAGDNDTNHFTDADLSILGSAPEMYIIYTQQIRREYSIYPDLLYRPGRKKVLAHFIAMPRIFKTGHFYNKYEQAARANMQNELDSLG